MERFAKSGAWMEDPSPSVCRRGSGRVSSISQTADLFALPSPLKPRSVMLGEVLPCSNSPTVEESEL